MFWEIVKKHSYDQKDFIKEGGKNLISSPKSEFLKVKILPQNLHFYMLP